MRIPRAEKVKGGDRRGRERGRQCPLVTALIFLHLRLICANRNYCGWIINAAETTHLPFCYSLSVSLSLSRISSDNGKAVNVKVVLLFSPYSSGLTNKINHKEKLNSKSKKGEESFWLVSAELVNTRAKTIGLNACQSGKELRFRAKDLDLPLCSFCQD